MLASTDPIRESYPDIYQTAFGIIIFWLSFRRPLTWRGGDPIENEKFVRIAFRILAAALIFGGLSGLWLSWRLR